MSNSSHPKYLVLLLFRTLYKLEIRTDATDTMTRMKNLLDRSRIIGVMLYRLEKGITDGYD